jgi:gluconate 2-dehydrogenase gamma chain
MRDKGVSRRRLLAAGALAGALPIAPASAGVIRGDVPWQEGAADRPTPAQGGKAYAFFTPAEAAFIEAAVGRLIPADDLGPGALEAGVPTFIDRQLAGEFGRGGRWYMQGPWGKGTPTQGYQTRLTPAQMYRSAIRDIDTAVGREANGATFAGLKAADQDAFLKRLEGGQVQLASVDAKAFFDILLQNTIEGFFSDPIYGGNRDMVGWKLIGFPGARYDHSPYVTRHGEKYPLTPVGLTGRPDWARR